MAHPCPRPDPCADSRPLEDSLGTPVAWMDHRHSVRTTVLHLDRRTRETGVDRDHHEKAIAGEDTPRFAKEGIHVIEVGEGQDRYHPRGAAIGERHRSCVALHQGRPSPARQSELIPREIDSDYAPSPRRQQAEVRPGAVAGIDTEPGPRTDEAADVLGHVIVDGVLQVFVVPRRQPVVSGLSHLRVAPR